MKKVYIFLITFFVLSNTSPGQKNDPQIESPFSNINNPGHDWEWDATQTDRDKDERLAGFKKDPINDEAFNDKSRSFTIVIEGSKIVGESFDVEISGVTENGSPFTGQGILTLTLIPIAGFSGVNNPVTFTNGNATVSLSIDAAGKYTVTIAVLSLASFQSLGQSSADVNVVNKAWTGQENTDWNDGDNWNPAGVPGSTDYLLIPGETDFNPTITSSANFRSLTIESGAILTLPNTVDLEINNEDSELYIGSGAAFIVNGSFAFNGTINSFGNITIDSNAEMINTGVLNLEAGEIVNSGHFINIVNENPGTINALGGSLIIEPNAKMDADGSSLQNFNDISFLEIKSDASGTGSFIHATAGVSARVQRWMTGQQFHIISPPVSGQTIEAFIDNNVNIAKNSSGQYALRHYDPASGWSDFYTDQTTGDMLSGTAYAVALESDGFVRFEGTLRRSNIDIDIPYQSGAFGWNGVGNPFVASIGARSAALVNDFLTQNSTQLAVGYEAIYLYDPTREVGTRYHTINNAGGSLIDYLSIGQGFIVKAKDASSSVTFDPNMRSHQPDDFYKQDSDESSWHSLRLVATSGQKRGHTFVAFNDNMTTGLDATYDAGMYVEDASFHIYTHMPDGSSDLNLGIQALPDYGFETMLIPVGLHTASAVDVTFSLAENILPGYLVPVLEDHELGTYTDLSMQNYTVNVDAGSDPLGRFFLRMVNMSTLYTIHFGVDGQGGSLTAELEDGTPVFPGDEFPYGTGINFTATADEGYTVKEWTINGNIEEDFYGHELSYDHLLGDLQVMVAFEETATNVIEPFTDSEVIIYTFENYIYIKGNQGENTRAVLYDTMGRAILSKQLLISETNKINVKGITTGVYVLHILGEKQQISEKILIR